MLRYSAIQLSGNLKRLGWQQVHRSGGHLSTRIKETDLKSQKRNAISPRRTATAKCIHLLLRSYNSRPIFKCELPSFSTIAVSQVSMLNIRDRFVECTVGVESIKISIGITIDRNFAPKIKL